MAKGNSNGYDAYIVLLLIVFVVLGALFMYTDIRKSVGKADIAEESEVIMAQILDNLDTIEQRLDIIGELLSGES